LHKKLEKMKGKSKFREDPLPVSRLKLGILTNLQLYNRHTVPYCWTDLTFGTTQFRVKVTIHYAVTNTFTRKSRPLRF